MTQINKSAEKNPPQVYGVPCIGITEKAPRSGFQAKDIPLPEWNEYQLSKSR